MTFTYRHKKEIIFATILVLLSVIIGFILFQKSFNHKTSSKEVVLNSKKVEEKEVKAKEEDENYYLVDIKGEVNNPGIYTVKENSRVIDVIRLAGDLTSNADTSLINLSKKVTDEMVIIIYSHYEVENFSKTKEIEERQQESCLKQSEIINGACIENNNLSDDSESLKISINNATIDELMLLPGIGEAKAKDIISYRQEVGPFQNIEEIKKVNGIGESLFDKIKENITI